MKNKPRFAGFPVLILLSVLLWGCRTDEELTEAAQEIDAALEYALSQASDGEGMAFFRFPNRQDLASIPQDPNNPITAAKVELGRLLYHETALARNAKYRFGNNTFSCASCHSAAAGFQAGLAQGIGDGGIGYGSRGEGRRPNPTYPVDSLDVQPLRTPSALNIAFQEVVMWNGQFGATGLNAGTQARWTAGTPLETNHLGYQGVETQAIAGLEVHRLQIDRRFLNSIPMYRNLFNQVFGDRPQEQRITRETAGLAIAAYERTLFANEAPFQRWLNGDRQAMNDMEKSGALLFFGKANCVSCHTGPALNSMSFHALGMRDLSGPGVRGVSAESAAEAGLGRGGFTQRAADNYKFKTPQLYNLAHSRFYGHGSSFTSVRQVIEYYNRGVPENAAVPASQISPLFTPLELTDEEVAQLTAFVERGLLDPNLDRYQPASLPSGNCFPNNDPTSQVDLGCNVP